MKPRTKLEKRVTGLSGKLSAVTEVQKEWAKEHIFTHEAYRCKDELWCSECGGTWIDTSNSELGTTLLGDTTECPYCHHKLDVKVSRKRKVEEEKYMSILQTAGEFQIIRHIQLKEDIASFYNRMERFFGMEIKGDGIVIRPLESVTQFYKEGKAMHHCVYANRYYRRSECLIMTAIVGEKHVETIEVNLKSFQIVQSRAVCNGTSEYHDCIIRLVEKNMSLIKKLTA